MGRLARNLMGVSVRECARVLGVSDTAIHKAIKAGRCGQHADKSVDIEAVRIGMSLTADPFRGGQRQAGVFGELGSGPAVSLEDAGPQVQIPMAAPASVAVAPPAAGGKVPGHSLLLDARTATEQAKAERTRIDLERLKGTVAEIEPMTRAVFDAMTAARGELMSLPDRLTPMVTPETDAGKVYSMIEAEIVRICETLRDKLMQHATQTETASA